MVRMGGVPLTYTSYHVFHQPKNHILYSINYRICCNKKNRRKYILRIGISN